MLDIGLFNPRGLIRTYIYKDFRIEPEDPRRRE
jgi:hypothetical protein